MMDTIQPVRVRKTGSFLQCESGLAFVEFAIVVPVLIILFLATVEICRFILITQKLENTVTMVTDVVTQYNTATSGGPINSTAIAPVYSAVTDMMNPYSFGANGIIFLTDVQADSSGNPVVQWQSCGGGTLSATSTIGAPGATANFSHLPGGGFAMTANEEVVVGEAFYNFTPITSQNFLSSVQLYRTALFVPRINTLVSTTPPTCP